MMTGDGMLLDFLIMYSKWIKTRTRANVLIVNVRMPKKPGEEFELAANSLGAQIETHGVLILRAVSYLTVNSYDDSLSELFVSFL